MTFTPRSPRQTLSLPVLLLMLSLLLFFVTLFLPESRSHSQPETSPAGLTSSQWANIQGIIQHAAYQFTWHEPTQAFHAPNQAQQFDLALNEGELQVSVLSLGPTGQLSLSLLGYGLPNEVHAPGQPTLFVEKDCWFSEWSTSFSEWIYNSPNGVEIGFLVFSPVDNTDGSQTFQTFQIDLQLHTTFTPHLSSDSQTLLLQTSTGKNVLRYDHLKVTDADGRSVPAHFQLITDHARPAIADHQLSILISPSSSTTYPLTISTLLHNEIAKLLASDAAADDQLGTSVAISGDTVVVGAPGGDSPSDSGAAYVFTRNQEGADAWGQVIKLKASDADNGDYFGWAVAISGDTITIGARWDESLGANSGAVYIYARNQNGSNNWGEVTKLLASDGTGGEEFGYAAAMDGDTLLVGAPLKNSGDTDAGGVYIFRRNEGGADNWGEVTDIDPFDFENNQQFGYSVGISGDTIVVGSYLDNGPGGSDQGSAYVYSRNTGGADNWGLVKKLTSGDGASADTFGYSVGIHGGVIVVGARFNNPGGGFGQGTAYVFERNGGGANNWGQALKLVADDGAGGDEFGNSVSIDHDTIAIGAWQAGGSAGAGQGAVYVFRRNANGADTWAQVSKLTPADAAANDRFGQMVAVGGNTLIVGASRDDDTSGIDQGSAYMFVDQDFTWEEAAKTTANDANGGDAFGYTVALNNDTLVIGARQDDTIALDTGSAYIFERNSDGVGGQDADNWGVVRKITANDAAMSDQFGWSVSISDDWIAVGANHDDSSKGSVYLYSRNQGGSDNWGFVKKIMAPGGIAGDEFGWSVSLSGDTLVVGAPLRDGIPGLDVGTAYVFSRNQGGGDMWGFIAELVPSLVEAGNQFGYSVAMNDGTILIGAPYRDIVSDEGIAFVFSRNMNGADAWGQVAFLLDGDAGPDDLFGYSVAVSGDIAIVGAPFDDDAAGADQGTAHIFARNAGGADSWGLVTELNSNDPAADDQFGASVSISSGMIVVGATGDDDFGGTSGSIYVFERNVGGANQWGQISKLLGSEIEAGDRFGSSVAVSGKNIAAGAPGDNDSGNGSGAAYVFQTEIYVPPTPLPTNTPTITPTVTPGPSPTPVPGNEKNYLPLVIHSP